LTSSVAAYRVRGCLTTHHPLLEHDASDPSPVRTSENPLKPNFRELLFHVLG
jgi:hypothetical protein